MNPRIRELAEQAGAVFEKTVGLNDCPQDSLVDDEIQKFAELIVQDCIDQVDIKNELVSEVVFQTLELAKRRIRKHFEVE